MSGRVGEGHHPDLLRRGANARSARGRAGRQAVVGQTAGRPIQVRQTAYRLNSGLQWARPALRLMHWTTWPPCQLTASSSRVFRRGALYQRLTGSTRVPLDSAGPLAEIHAVTSLSLIRRLRGGEAAGRDTHLSLVNECQGTPLTRRMRRSIRRMRCRRAAESISCNVA